MFVHRGAKMRFSYMQVCSRMLLLLGCGASALGATSACGSDDSTQNSAYVSPDTGDISRPSSAPCADHTLCDASTIDSSSSSTSLVDGRILTLADSSEMPLCLTVDDDSGDWVRSDGTIGATSTTNVPNDGPPTPNYAATATQVRSNGVGGVGGFVGCGIVRDGNYLYVTSVADNSILRLTITKTADFAVVFGDDVVKLPGFTTPSSIAVDSDYIYVTEYFPGTIHRFPKASIGDGGAPDGGAGDVFPTDGGTSAMDILVDDTSIYWTLDEGVIRKMPKTGGAVEDLSDQGGVLHEIGDSLYFVCGIQLCTVAVGGGITAPLEILGPTSNDGPVPLGVYGLATFGNDLYFADGMNMRLRQVAEGTLFGYSDTIQAVTLLAQKGRLVWSDGSSIKTLGGLP